MPTCRLILEYDGTDFHGWQVQPGRPTVQQALEEALAILLKQRVAVVGSGRTDAGVHARGQVAHFRAGTLPDLHRLRSSLNGLLPRSIAVLDAVEAPDDFHARYDARQRRYHYYVSTGARPLERHWRWLLRPVPDFDRMNVSAQGLLGTHDFSAFCLAQSDTKNRVCTVEKAVWEPEERPGDVRFVVVADRFLHGMVRAIVGTLVEIGRGQRPGDDLARVLASRDRQQAGAAAPPHGLVLEQVGYAATGSENALVVANR
jgi:tRNA pseudouridine38-40 synthase